jgi:hypothetical protein
MMFHLLPPKEQHSVNITCPLSNRGFIILLMHNTTRRREIFHDNHPPLLHPALNDIREREMEDIPRNERDARSYFNVSDINFRK